MRDITSIELQKTTHRMLKSIGGMSESFDNVINRLIIDHKEVDKFILNYIDLADGKCINEVILGRRVFANHHFCVGDGKCKKCGIKGPIILKNDNIVINNKISRCD